ncbi:DUF6452 family protein [Labilibacter marinus]|uniref:DUF6452 family protein n=1 Tax=Labilibacter marinus TaxID=1477105 RepID=UPI000835F666|nr:DUF6452 family protein [Labilibacter marinus]
MKIFSWTLILLSVLGVYACSNQGSDFCLSNQQAVQGGFYSASATSDKDTSVIGIDLYGVGGPGLLYDSASVSKIFMPLNMETDTTQFVLEINKLRDTISFIHQKELNFVSGECGYIFSFYIDSVYYTDRSFIDTVIVDYDKVIYNENLENVKIYLYN